MIENSYLVANDNMIFSQQSDSFNISKIQRKEMSQLSRRDLSRIDDTSEMNNGSKSNIAFNDNSNDEKMQRKIEQNQHIDDHFFSQATQAKELKSVLNKLNSK